MGTADGESRSKIGESGQRLTEIARGLFCPLCAKAAMWLPQSSAGFTYLGAPPEKDNIGDRSAEATKVLRETWTAGLLPEWDSKIY